MKIKLEKTLPGIPLELVHEAEGEFIGVFDGLRLLCFILLRVVGLDPAGSRIEGRATA